MRKNICRGMRYRAFAGFLALAVLTAGNAAMAEDDAISVGSDADSDSSDTGESDPGPLVEDSGEEVQVNLGVDMDTLQDAMDSGDRQTVEQIASIGDLQNQMEDSDSGIALDASYRDDSERVQELYNSLSLSINRESETELNESPGLLPAADSARIQESLYALTQVDDPTGSDGELTIGSYIKDTLSGLGYTVQAQAFHEGVLNEDGIDPPGVNILAERGANSQKNRKKDILLVVTHYDSKRHPDEDDPFANDKTGAAALIETARILAQVVTDTDICFVFLSGHEDGGYGAEKFLASLSEENRSRITGVLCVDRVGYDSDTPYVLRTMSGESNGLGEILQQYGIRKEALDSLIPDGIEIPQENFVWVGTGESSDGYIDEEAARQIAAARAQADPSAQTQADAAQADPSAQTQTDAAQADPSAQTQADAAQADPSAQTQADAADQAQMSFSGTLAGAGAEENDESRVDVIEEIALDVVDVEAAPIPVPSAWSYLKQATATDIFAGASIPTVTLSQYMPQLDGADYDQTKALGLADTTASQLLEAQAQAQSLALNTTVPQDAILADSDSTGQTAVPDAIVLETNAGSVQPEDSTMTGSADDTAGQDAESFIEVTDSSSQDGSGEDTSSQEQDSSAQQPPDAISVQDQSTASAQQANGISVQEQSTASAQQADGISVQDQSTASAQQADAISVQDQSAASAQQADGISIQTGDGAAVQDGITMEEPVPETEAPVSAAAAGVPEDFFPVADAALIAEVTDVLTASIASIMDPAT